MGPQLPNEHEVSKVIQEPAVVIPPIVLAQLGVYTLEKFIKNGVEYFKGTRETDKAKAWTLNTLKTFRAIEVHENHG